MAWCSANVLAKHEVPFFSQITKNIHDPSAGASAALTESDPAAAMGVKV